MSNHFLSPGHTACAGCGQSLAARLVIDASGPNTIVVNNTGCLEVFSTKYPETAWEVPWIHSLFENAAAVASGVESALRYLGKKIALTLLPRLATEAQPISACRHYPECWRGGTTYYMSVMTMKLI